MNVLSIDIDFLFTEMREYHKYINEDIALSLIPIPEPTSQEENRSPVFG